VKRRDEVEQHMRVIAGAGGLLFVCLVATLFFVQTRLASSQAVLAESVVPLQAALASLSAGVGDVFERQSQLGSTRSLAQLEALTIDPTLADRVRESRRTASAALASLDSRSDAQQAAEQELEGQVEAFLVADRSLLESVRRRHTLQAQFDQGVRTVEDELRAVTEASFGIAGVLRLDYVTMLRRLDEQARTGQVDAAAVRASIMGAERAQLDAMNQLDAAVLRLSALSGKVGLAADVDALNSITANELSQTRSALGRALDEISSLTRGHPDLAPRVAALEKACTAALAHIGDEARDDSLVRLRRRVFEEWKLAENIRTSALTSARALETSLAAFDAAAEAQKEASTRQAAATVWGARAASIVISLVGVAVCLMAASRLRRSIVALRAKNAALEDLSANLEKKVAERTLELKAREEAMQVVLDSTGEGLVTARPDGTLLLERSRAMTEWFGPATEGQTLWGLLFPDRPKEAEALRIGFEQLVDGFLPFDVAVEQMARRVPKGEQTLELDFRQVFKDGQFVSVLVVVRDVTRRVAAERAEYAARELQALVGTILRDRTGFGRIVADCESLLTSLRSCDLLTGRRLLHTLKGNAAVAGFLSVADHVHALETTLEGEERHLRPDELEALEQQWKAALARIEEYLPKGDGEHVELDVGELGRFEQKLERRVDHLVLLDEVRGWRAEPADAVLQRLATQARRLAPKLGRKVRVEVASNHVRLPPHRFDSFFTAAVHLVRNAIDHGLEPGSERTAAQKPEEGLLRLETQVSGGRLLVVVEDDGRGVNWDAVRAAAVRKGLPADTREALVDAMFSDGVSSRAEVTDISGRGVGLAAVREAVLAESGHLTVDSTPGKGTRFTFVFPLVRLAQAA
jgi:two-component system chemotaxis sensor kinase CheA